MTCVFEKNYTMPLCAKENNIYYDLFRGDVIEDEKIIEFINNGIKNKRMTIKDINIAVYAVYRYIMPTYDRCFEYYNLKINGISNFLTIRKQPVDEYQRQYITRKFSKGSLFQQKVWGDDD